MNKYVVKCKSSVYNSPWSSTWAPSLDDYYEINASDKEQALNELIEIIGSKGYQSITLMTKGNTYEYTFIYDQRRYYAICEIFQGI